MTTTAHEHVRNTRPLFGLRRQPGRLALVFMRTPRPLYRHGWGWLLGHTFLLITHQGRKTGKRRETVAMALTYDPDTREAVIFSAWGPNTEWMRNLRAHPALQIQIGRETYVPEQHFLSEDEAVAVALEFRRRHPLAVAPLRRHPRLGRPQHRAGHARLRAQPTLRLVSPGASSADGSLTHDCRAHAGDHADPPPARRSLQAGRGDPLCVGSPPGASRCCLPPRRRSSRRTPPSTRSSPLNRALGRATISLRGLVTLALLGLAVAAYPQLAGRGAGSDRGGTRSARTRGSGARQSATPRRPGRVARTGPGSCSAPSASSCSASAVALVWRSRKPGRLRWLRRTGLAALTVVGAYLLVVPVAMAILATHRPRADVTPADLGRQYEQVTVRTADGLRLAGWYVRSRNGAAVISYPTRAGQAAAGADAGRATATASCCSTRAATTAARATRTCSAGTTRKTSTPPSPGCSKQPDVTRADGSAGSASPSAAR